jgi:hypothetical protein
MRSRATLVGPDALRDRCGRNRSPPTSALLRVRGLAAGWLRRRRRLARREIRVSFVWPPIGSLTPERGCSIAHARGEVQSGGVSLAVLNWLKEPIFGPNLGRETTMFKPASTRAAVFVAAIALCGTMAIAAPAHASATDTSDDSPSTYQSQGTSTDDGSTVFSAGQTELTVRPAVAAPVAAQSDAARAPSIGCSLNVQNVHASSHVSGTINGVAVVSCTGAAGSMVLHYSLIRVSPNNTQWGAGSKTNAGKSSIQNNRAVDCSEGPGEFQGWAQGEIAPPPGYELAGPATHSDYGPSNDVACGLSRSGEDPGLSESMSVTFVRSDLVQ